MRRFRFPLETLRRVRAHQERLERARALEARHQWEKTQQELESHRERFEASLHRAVDWHQPALWRALHGYILQELEALEEHRRKAAWAEERWKQIQDRWIRARQAHEVLERLRERAWERFHQELERQEGAELDELAIQRIRFPQHGGGR
jgi:flagellar export protein FliJ|nr:MAG: hypothetical protein KatS3mg041_0549 [Bacteroidota bacterium]